MFVAEDKEGLRYYSFEAKEDLIRDLSQSNLLICPDCRERVIYRSGTKRPHYAHYRECSNPNPYSEPETPTHRNGKVNLYWWLKKLYPKSTVELEYYIPETKQRSDIIVIHPDGARWAFEFQCSKIPGYAWKERHGLYQQANVMDIWILNREMARRSEYQVRVCGLEAAIYKTTNRINYLDVELREVFILVCGRLDGQSLYRSRECHSSLDKVSIRDGELWTESYKQYLAEVEEKSRELKKNEQQKVLRKKLNVEREAQEQEKSRRDIVQYSKEILIERSNLSKDMTSSEKSLFLKLASKYNLEPANFPGIFHLDVQDSNHIITPKPFWQLWIYDTLVTSWEYAVRKGKEPRVWTEKWTDNFKQLRSRGLLRTSGNYIFPFYNYLDLLNQCGIMMSLGTMTTKYQKLLVKRIPLFNSHKQNIAIRLYWEGFRNQSIESAAGDFVEQIAVIRNESSLLIKAAIEREHKVTAARAKSERVSRIHKQDPVLDDITEKVLSAGERRDLPLDLITRIQIECKRIIMAYRNNGFMTNDQLDYLMKTLRQTNN